MGLTRRRANAAGMTEVVPTSGTEVFVQEEGSTGMVVRSRDSRRRLGAQLAMQADVVGASSAMVGRTENRCQGCAELMMS
jgi:hypothetical protein